MLNPTEYTKAFEAGRLEVMRYDWRAADALCFLSTSPDADDYVCFLCSRNGREEEEEDLPDGLEEMEEEEAMETREEEKMEEEDVDRNWRVPGIKVDKLGQQRKVDPHHDYSALAGQAERKCMELLGFAMTCKQGNPIQIGHGIDERGFIEETVLQMWDVDAYVAGIWGCHNLAKPRKGRALQYAQTLKFSPDGLEKIKKAKNQLQLVEGYRKQDMKKLRGSNAAHKHQLKQISDTRQELEGIISSATFNLSALTTAL